MPNGTYGGVRGRKTKVGRKLSFSSYSIVWIIKSFIGRPYLTFHQPFYLSHPDSTLLALKLAVHCSYFSNI